MLQPGEVGVASWGYAVDPPLIFLESISSPARHVKRRIGQDVICLQSRVQILEECVSRPGSQVRLNPADSEVHLTHFPSGWIGLLAIYGNILQIALMALHEPGRLHEHAPTAAAGVVDPALIGL